MVLTFFLHVLQCLPRPSAKRASAETLTQGSSSRWTPYFSIVGGLPSDLTKQTKTVHSLYFTLFLRFKPPCAANWTYRCFFFFFYYTGKETYDLLSNLFRLSFLHAGSVKLAIKSVRTAFRPRIESCPKSQAAGNRGEETLYPT